MRNWIRRWLGIETIELRQGRMANEIAHLCGVTIPNINRNLELARAAIRENTLPMEDRKATSVRIAEEAIRKMRGPK